MRNKYAALALGLALTITAMPVMAASTTNTATTERSAKSDDASTPPEEPDGEAPGS